MLYDFKDLKVWKEFLIKYKISNEIEEKLVWYINFLIEENKKYNLTSITNISEIIRYHLADSIEIIKFDLFNKYNKIADIGTGAGIPGLILAIIYPEKEFYLIEVTKKKINFLYQCLEKFELKNCKIWEEDFKTFVRSSNIDIDCFIARASLNLNEISYIWNGKSIYKNSEIIYWGSFNWKEDPNNEILKYKINTNEYKYKIGHKIRYYINVMLQI